METDKQFSLRSFTDDDAESLARHLNNKKVLDNLRDVIPYPYTLQDAQWYINFQRNDTQLRCYAIVVDNQVVGNVGFIRRQDIERFTAELGYYLGEQYWGRGIMSAALNEAIADYFNTTDVVRLFATPFEQNKASAKVLENAGFTLKCTFTKGAYKNGEFVDMLYYEKIK